MRVMRLAATAVTAALYCGCSSEIVFECQADEQCVGPGDVEGICQVGGSCSYEDLDCPSQQRYSTHAAPDLAGYCVPSLPGIASDGSTSQLPDDTPADSAGGSTGMSNEPCTPETVELEPILAACRSDGGHGPWDCKQTAGPELILIDQESSQLGGATVTSYLTFVAPEPLLRVQSAQLHMWTHDDDDGSDAAGELWRTDPFNGDSLRTESPALQDRVAEDPGDAPPGTELIYELEAAALEDESTFYFAIVPMSDDGLRFIANDVPGQLPRFVVDYCGP